MQATTRQTGTDGRRAGSMAASWPKAGRRDQIILRSLHPATISRSSVPFPLHPDTRLATITLDYGAEDPLVLETAEGSLVTECRGPAGVAGAAASDRVAAALAAPLHGPPLAAHVVPGDSVAVAVADAVPQAAAVIAAVIDGLCAAGVEADAIHVLHAARRPETATAPGVAEFDATVDAATSYLAADEAGNPLYLARQLVDADVVVAVGEWGWDAALGGRALSGELWPAFSRRTAAERLTIDLARRGRLALADWKARMHDIAWQLGVCASLRLVAGRAGSLHAATFGLPDEASRSARAAARAWCPSVEEPAELAVASLSDPRSFAALTTALAAAARVTRPDGTICLACRVATAPGIVFQRWRQGASLERLVHEAVGTRNAELVADALQARLFARALGDRRLVLLSDIDEAAVEDLEFGFAGGPDVIARLVERADSLAVLHEADRMLPQAAV